MNETIAYQLIKALPELNLPSKSADDFEQMKQALSQQINHLINSDFATLVNLLYRLDIPENKLKAALSNAADTPTGDVIADMIIERQQEKEEARNLFKNKGDIPEEERW